VGDEMITLPPVDLAKLRDRLPSHFYRARHVQKAYRDEIRKAKEKDEEEDEKKADKKDSKTKHNRVRKFKKVKRFDEK